LIDRHDLLATLDRAAGKRWRSSRRPPAAARVLP